MSPSGMPRGEALLGRARELTWIADQLRRHHVVSVVGPGGVGKTSLVLTSLARRYPTFAEEGGGSRAAAIWCGLADLEDPSSVRDAVATAIGVQNPQGPLGGYLPVNDAVVVALDNCEHVVDVVADVVAELVEAGPHVRVLTTSREPLRLRGEAVLRLGPLAVPSDAGTPSPAVELFVRRAEQARPGFDAEPGARARVAEICRRLDGLPLALELVAARVRSTSLAALADGLEASQGAPTSDLRDVPGRHRSLERAVAWSYALLTPPEQRFFTDLCVQVGGFGREAALATARISGLDEAAADEHLDGLVAKSLVVLGGEAGRLRYRVLEPLREFGVARLRQDGRMDRAREQHAAHYAEVVRALVELGRTQWSPRLGALFEEFDNVRSAVLWSVEHDATADRCLDLLSGQWYVGLQEASEEIARLCDRVLDRWPDRRHPRASEVWATGSVCLLALDDLDGARSRAERAIDADTSAMGRAWAWRTLAETSHYRHQVTQALDELDRADAEAERAGFEPLRCDMLGSRVAILVQARRDDEARACAERALRWSAAQGNVYEHAWDLHLLGMLVVEQDPGQGERWLRSALEESLALPYPYGIRASHRGLGLAASFQGRHTEAAADLLRALDLFDRAGMGLQRLGCVAAAVPVLLGAGRRREAAVVAAHLAAHDAAFERIAAPGFEAALTDLRGDVADPETRVRGGALTVDQLLAVLRAALGDLATQTPRSGPAASGETVEAPTPDGPPGVDPPTAQLRRRGALWELTFAGVAAPLPTLKGLDDLAVLLASPGREIAALDLLTPGGPGRARRPPEELGIEGDLGEVSDHTARAAYAQRLRDLQEELDGADAAGDAARATRAQAEFDAITEHLTAAYGLRGARRTGDPAERARATVTARLRAAIAKVTDAHPAAGAHLAAHVHTGRLCRYAAKDGPTWQVEP